MNKMLKNNSGASLVEYALLLCMVAGLALSGLHTLGTALDQFSNTLATTLASDEGLQPASGSQSSSTTQNTSNSTNAATGASNGQQTTSNNGNDINNKGTGDNKSNNSGNDH